MLFRVFSLMISMALFIGCITPASATEIDTAKELQAASETVEENKPKSVDPITITIYENTLDMGTTIYYGSWRNGVSGGREYTDVSLSFDQSYDLSYDISFTASVSGEYSPANGNTIGSELGVTLGVSRGYSIGGGTSVTVPAGERYLIVYRPAYYICKVTEYTYKEVYGSGYLLNRYLYDTKVCYVNVFSHWDYDAIPV